MDNKLLNSSTGIEFKLAMPLCHQIDMKKTLSLITALIVAVSASVQSEQPWLVSDSKLLPSGGLFEIVLAPNNGNENRAVTIRINPDEKTIAYNKLNDRSKLPGLPVTIDLSNQSERNALVALLEAYKQHAVGQELARLMGNDGSVHLTIANSRHRAAFKTATGQYGGALGQCVGFSEFYDSKPDQPLCFSLQGKFDQVDLVLPEPAALLWTINHQDELLQLRSAALKKKQGFELAAQQATEAKRQADLATAKAVEDERAKAEAAKRQEQLAEQEKQQQIQAIKNAQIEAKHNKALAFLETSEGKKMAEEINLLGKAIPELDKKERLADCGDLLDQQKTYFKQMNDLHLDDYERREAGRKYAASLIDVADARAKHTPSDKLKRMQNQFDLITTQFEKKSGMPYGDAIGLKRN